MKNLKIMAIGQTLMLLLSISCKKNENPPEVYQNTKFYTVSMTDNPGNYAGLSTEIKGVAAFSPKKGWVVLNSNTQVVEVLKLTNGKEILLGSISDSAAFDFTKLKIIFGQHHWLKLKCKGAYPYSGEVESSHELEFEGDKELIIELGCNLGNAVLIDFDVAASIIRDGDKYILKPCIKVIKDAKTGVSGKLSGESRAAVSLSNGEKTYIGFANAEGEFLIRGIEEGTYDLSVIIQSGDEKLAFLVILKLKGVIVKKGEITAVGVIQL
ncbi:MAG: DUF4382 domain-containing protein [Bacteroidota bacterium]|nr:DUF4382 domain-containing protein [Bacteroidota bacterium]